jgi:hypothetical protein
MRGNARSGAASIAATNMCHERAAVVLDRLEIYVLRSSVPDAGAYDVRMYTRKCA